MGYISKELLKKAYNTLSNLTPDHKQGQTQIVSALRYVVALDMFYHTHNKECELDNVDARNQFTLFVNQVVNVCSTYYTANFYTTIEDLEDCRVGSNFYSAGVVAKSKVNQTVFFDYPTRGSFPLFRVKNNVLYREISYIKNLSNYLPNDHFKSAFAIWLLRNREIEDLDYENVKESLLSLLTPDLVNQLLPKPEVYLEYTNGFVLEDEKPTIAVQDFIESFASISNDNEKTYNEMDEIKNVNQSYRTLSYLTALRTKPFMLLAGISGTGKSRIVRKLAQASVTEELQKQYDPKSVVNGFDRWELHKPANFEIIQVKPNWHNSLEVVGYKSNIGGAHYEFTPFIEFVARAWKHPGIPFFLCLDEMNLAPVEQYFAEFLSAIESRSIENGVYETDPIIKPFAEFGDNLWKSMVNHLLGEVNASDATQDSSTAKLVERFKTKGLTLPQNLLVLGTVNMDETTFSFSRKVLDRAMSVVMNDVEYNRFFLGETENDVVELDEREKSILINRPIRGLNADENHATEVKDYLIPINELLDNTPFKLGYRAANEALLYVSAAHKFSPDITLNTALDEFTMMKILSRIEGDKRSIGDLLERLKTVITEAYPKSHDKLVKMAKTLLDKQFVSYWT